MTGKYYKWMVNVNKFELKDVYMTWDLLKTVYTSYYNYKIPKWFTSSELQHFNRKEDFVTFHNGYRYSYTFRKIEVE